MDPKQVSGRRSNERQSIRFPVAGPGEAELEFPEGGCFPVRIMDESAGGFGLYCNADVSVWVNEILLLHRGEDTFEVRVAHVSEIEIPVRDGCPEPEWLPLRIGLERRRLVCLKARRGTLWERLKRPSRGDSPPALHPMYLLGLVLAAFAVGAPYASDMLQKSDNPYVVTLRAKSVSLADTITSWLQGFGSGKNQGQGTTPSYGEAREWVEDTFNAVDDVNRRMDAAVVPARLKANAVIDDAKQRLNRTAQNAADLQERVANESDRLAKNVRDSMRSKPKEAKPSQKLESREEANGAADSVADGNTAKTPSSSSTQPTSVTLDSAPKESTK